MQEVVLAAAGPDEHFGPPGLSNGSVWCPSLDTVERLYGRLKQSQYIEFKWKCPGRSFPNPEQKSADESEKPVIESMETSGSGAYDFDFDDDAGPMPQKLPSKTNTPKNSTKKRTTLAGIVANMEKHRIMDKMDSSSKSFNN